MLLAGCGGGEDPPAVKAAVNASAPNGQSAARPTGIDPAGIPLPEVETGICLVYTPQPGFVVLVDGDLVWNEKTGQWLTTPCAVTLPVGNHDIKVARAGFRDTPFPGRVRIAAGKEAEVFLEPVEDPLGVVDSVLDAPYLQAEVGQPIALESLNSTGLETDPYVTADGLAIYFVADRPEGRGVFYATRPSPYVPFFPPQLLQVSRGLDEKATPSITGDSRMLAYAMPGKQRVVALSRETPLGDFIDKQNLTYSSRTDQFWRSAQILADGLRLYWTVDTGGKLETRSASRNAADEPFGNVLRVALPGVHPCLSDDGLRQYAFDGKTLRRARRGQVNARFSRPETIASVRLDNYVRDEKRRQFFVTGDEQWLFYCDNPRKRSDLYMVRLSRGAAWGFAARGKNIPQSVLAADDKPSDEPEKSASADNDTPAVDPRQLPLPYTAHRQTFLKLMQSKQYAAAKQLVEQALADEKQSGDREVQNWDRGDVGRVLGFWDDVRRSLREMKPGDEIRFGRAEVALVKFENDEITARTRTKEFTKRIQEMDPTDLMSLADRVVDKSAAAGQLRMGTFLYYDPAGTAGSAESRFERAGRSGVEFYERQAARLLHQARQEFERDRIAAGLVFIARAITDFPDTRAAGEAKELEARAYQFTKWRQRGRWERGTEGEFIAPAGRAADSYLISPRAYENFELRLQWKTEAGGSGGVFFRYRGSGDPNLYGYKIHLADDFGRGRTDPQTTGALLNTASPVSNAVRKTGEWNTLRMQVRGTQVTVEINGKKVLDRQADIDEFKAAGGYVMLDGVAGGISYRQTLLVELE